MNLANSEQQLDAFLADYVSGELTVPAKVLADAHMELVPDSRRWVQCLEDVAGVAMDDGEPEPLSDRDSMLDAIFSEDDKNRAQTGFVHKEPLSKDGWMPAAIREFVGVGPEDITWRRMLPGIKVYDVGDIDGCEVSIIRVKQGTAIPVHTHEGRELTLVLKGAFDDGQGHYAIGDLSIADETVDHRPVAGLEEECICFIVNDASLRFTGKIGRIINRLMPS